MKVLLCEDIGSLGWLGDVVEVKEGYARNYLLPQGLANELNGYQYQWDYKVSEREYTPAALRRSGVR